jgi:hypothetical protein
MTTDSKEQDDTSLFSLQKELEINLKRQFDEALHRLETCVQNWGLKDAQRCMRAALNEISLSLPASNSYIGVLRTGRNEIEYVCASSRSNMVGNILSRGQGVSFQCIDMAKAVQVEYDSNVSATENGLHIFDENFGGDARGGAGYLGIPILGRSNTVLGVIGIDNIINCRDSSVIKDGAHQHRRTILEKAINGEDYDTIMKLYLWKQSKENPELYICGRIVGISTEKNGIPRPSAHFDIQWEDGHAEKEFPWRLLKPKLFVAPNHPYFVSHKYHRLSSQSIGFFRAIGQILGRAIEDIQREDCLRRLHNLGENPATADIATFRTSLLCIQECLMNIEFPRAAYLYDSATEDRGPQIWKADPILGVTIVASLNDTKHFALKDDVRNEVVNYFRLWEEKEAVIFLKSEPNRMLAKFKYPKTGAYYIIAFNHLEYPELACPDDDDIALFVREVVRETEYVLGCVQNRRLQRQTEEDILQSVLSLTIDDGEKCFLDNVLSLLQDRYLIKCNAYFGMFQPGGRELAFVAATKGSSMEGKILRKESNEGVSYGCSENMVSIVIHDLEKRYLKHLKWQEGAQISPETDDDILFPPNVEIQYRKGFELRKAVYKYFEARVSDAKGHLQFLCDTCSPLIIWYRSHKEVNVLVSHLLEKLHDEPSRWKLKRNGNVLEQVIIEYVKWMYWHLADPGAKERRCGDLSEGQKGLERCDASSAAPAKSNLHFVGNGPHQGTYMCSPVRYGGIRVGVLGIDGFQHVPQAFETEVQPNKEMVGFCERLGKVIGERLVQKRFASALEEVTKFRENVKLTAYQARHYTLKKMHQTITFAESIDIVSVASNAKRFRKDGDRRKDVKFLGTVQMDGTVDAADVSPIPDKKMRDGLSIYSDLKDIYEMLPKMKGVSSLTNTSALLAPCSDSAISNRAIGVYLLMQKQSNSPHIMKFFSDICKMLFKVTVCVRGREERREKREVIRLSLVQNFQDQVMSFQL